MINPNAQPIVLPSCSPVATIQRVVAGSYGVPLNHLLSDRRSDAWPRQVAMYLARELTSKSLPTIGRIFRRDHTTVIHACRRVEERIKSDALMRADIDALIDALAAVDNRENPTISKNQRPNQAIEQTVKTQEDLMAA